jgi:hypothetical protein
VINGWVRQRFQLRFAVFVLLEIKRAIAVSAINGWVVYRKMHSYAVIVDLDQKKIIVLNAENDHLSLK